MAINWQGAIPQSAKNFASRFQTETRWQKYICYEVIVRTAFNYTEELRDSDLLDFEPKEHDNWRLSNQPWRDEDENAIRAKYAITSSADLFRRSMNEGTSIWEMFFNGTLKNIIDPFELVDFAFKIVGGNEKLKYGRSYLTNHLDQYRSSITLDSIVIKDDSAPEILPISSIPDFGKKYKVKLSDDVNVDNVNIKNTKTDLVVKINERSPLVAQSEFNSWVESLKKELNSADVEIVGDEGIDSNRFVVIFIKK